MKTTRGRVTAALMLGTILGSGAPALAQVASPPLAAPLQPEPSTLAPPAERRVIQSLRVTGAQRLEPETVRVIG